MSVTKSCVVALLAFSSVSGCATITRGTKDVLIVESEPAGAKVTLSDGQTCAGTPCTFKLPRKSEIDVLFEKPGCRPVRMQVRNKVADAGGAAMAGNVLIGGLIGAGVDASTGAMLELVPNPARAKLQC